MSSINVINIKHPSASGNAITLAADGSAFINTGALGIRNRIINGDMRIDQRNNGASVNTDQAFPVDRFQQTFGGGGVITGQRSTTAPSGFTNSLLLTVSTADASIASTDAYNLQHKVEGFNVADFGSGTASAISFTLSFWVRSSVTGTYAGAVNNSAANRSYPFTYTINAANTFEFKSITITADTTGTWLSDNGIGFRILWDLGSGSSFNGTAGAWTGSNVFRTSGSVNWIANSGATFYITGVQLEAGTVATPFERRSFGQELALCQRYYQISYANTRGYSPSSGFVLETPIVFSPPMRIAPTCGLVGGNRAGVSAVNVATITTYGARHELVANITGDARAIGDTVQASSEL